jgi:hypothetical protein
MLNSDPSGFCDANVLALEDILGLQYFNDTYKCQEYKNSTLILQKLTCLYDFIFFLHQTASVWCGFPYVPFVFRTALMRGDVWKADKMKRVKDFIISV